MWGIFYVHIENKTFFWGVGIQWKDTPYEDFQHDSNKLEILSQYDNYLTKLQNICTENVGEEGKPVYETMKSAIQVFF